MSKTEGFVVLETESNKASLGGKLCEFVEFL